MVEAAGEALAEHGEGGGIQNIFVGAVGQVQFPDALLAQHRQGIVLLKYADMTRSGQTQTVADAHRAGIAQHRHRRGEGESAAQELRGLMIAGRNGNAAAGLAGQTVQRGVVHADHHVPRAFIGHKDRGAIGFLYGSGIDAVFFRLGAAAADKGSVIHQTCLHAYNRICT